MSTSQKLKHGVRFELVYRSHSDPLYADQNSSERVLVPVMPTRRRRRRAGEREANILDDVESVYSASTNRSASTVRSAQSTQTTSTYRSSASRMSRASKRSTGTSRTFEVVSVIDDNYDYSKHYRDIGGGVYIPADPDAPLLPAAEPDVAIEVVKGNKIFRDLPSDVFGTDVIESKASLLEELIHGGPVIDPDVMAALDAEEEEFEELEDNFVELANGEPLGFDEDEYDGEPVDDNELFPEDDDDEGDEDANHEEVTGKGKAPTRSSRLSRWRDSDEDEEEEEEEEESRYRNEVPVTKGRGPLRPIDEQFEEILNEYDSDEIGELDAYADDDTMRGNVELSQVTGVLNQFLAQQAKRTYLDLDDDNVLHNAIEGDGSGPVPLSRFETELLEQLERDDPERDNDTVLSYFGRDLKTSLQQDPELRKRLKESAPEGMKLYEGRQNEVTKNEVVSIVKKMLERQALMPEKKKPEYEIIEDEPDRELWDCETIVSTYSNLENHPTLIKEDLSSSHRRRRKNANGEEDAAANDKAEAVGSQPKQIQLSKKSGLPIGVLNMKREDDNNNNKAEVDDSEEDEEDFERVNLGAARPKKETAEEKRLRKKAMKEEKKIKREQKKEIKAIYKNEELNQRKIQSKLGIQKNTILKL